MTNSDDSGLVRCNYATPGLRHHLTALCAFGLLAALAQRSEAQTETNPGTNLPNPAQPSPQQVDEVVVSARRVNESVLTVPASISVLGNAELQNLNIQSFQDYALKIPNLSFQYGAGGNGYVNNREVSIRGISGNNTTGFYIDDTQVPVSLDPQVVDVQRIEVLKGPQGTLYGAGSMGGNVRVVTQQPTFTNEYSYTLSAGHTDHSPQPDGRAVGIGNLSVVDDIAAIRAVAVVDHEGGFVTRRWSDRLPGPYTPLPSPLGCCSSADNQGATTTYGGSVTLLIKPVDNFSVKARVMGQKDYDHGRRGVYAPLPTFEPNGYTVGREADFQETSRTAWVLSSLDLSYSGNGWGVTSSTSTFQQHVADIEDGTEGDLDFVYTYYGINLPPTCCGHHVSAPAFEHIFNEELRFTIDPIGPFRAIFGARYYRDTNNRSFDNYVIPGIAAAGLYPTDLAYNTSSNSRLIDKSVFGETYWKFGRFELTLGARRFEIRNENNPQGTAFLDGWYTGGYTPVASTASSESGTSPKAAISYEIAKDSLLYINASKGFRPGGPNAALPSLCADGLAQLGTSLAGAASYHSDNLWNYEVGGKTHLAGMMITAAAFQMKWSGIQESVIIPGCDLGATLNVGDARIRGGEFQVAGHPIAGVEASFGIGYQDPKLTGGGNIFPAGTRVLNVPTITGSIAMTYTHSLTSSLQGFISGDYSYTGNSTSATSGVPSERGGYGLLNARVGTQWDRYQFELYAKNLTNREANLGDLYLESISQLDRNGVVVPMVVVPPPLQVGLQVIRNF
jgi:iron complex outermembrane receptor protein